MASEEAQTELAPGFYWVRCCGGGPPFIMELSEFGKWAAPGVYGAVSAEGIDVIDGPLAPKPTIREPEVALDPVDVRFDSFQTANENPRWSVSATHIPTGIRVGPYEGIGHSRPSWVSRQSLMTELTGAVRKRRHG